MTVPTDSTRHLFALEVGRAESDIDLARAALLVAQEEYPQLPVDRYMTRIDLLAEEVRDRLDDEHAPLIVLQETIGTLYQRHGFKGNSEAYYDPRNSFLNDVLDRGTGIPLTLGIILLEVGWRLGLPLEGVNFPSHFLVRFAGSEVRVLVDPFEQGRLRFQDQAQEVLDGVYGGTVHMQDSFLARASKRQMLIRLLTDLKGLYVNIRDNGRALAAVERLLLLTPEAFAEVRDRGFLLARLGRVEEALDQFETYLGRTPLAVDASRVRGAVERLRSGDSVDFEEEGHA